MVERYARVDVIRLAPKVRKALAKRADLGRVTPHDLRHTCASLLIAANTPIQIVSRQLRHRNISMTWDVYGHLYPRDLNQVADTMEAIFG